MRGSIGLAVALSAIALAACSPKQTATAPAAPQPAAAPVAAAVPATSAADTAQAEPAPAASPPTTPEAAPPPSPGPAQAAPIRFSPSDYPAQERRIAGLLANAEARDTTGESQRDDADSHDQRLRCNTRACVLRSYAAQEARLRRWEGSSEIN